MFNLILEAYLIIGLLNYAVFAIKGNALLFIKHGGIVEGLVEALFFVFLWPLQFAFFLLNLNARLLEKIWNS